MFVGMFINLNMAVENSNKFSASAKSKIKEVLVHRFGELADMWTTENIELVFTEYNTPEEIDKFVEIYGAYYSKDSDEVLEHIRRTHTVRTAFDLVCSCDGKCTRSILVEKNIEKVIAREKLDILNCVY